MGDRMKYFSILGDSISTLEGYSEPRYAAYYDTAHKLQAKVYLPRDTWWGQVIGALGGQLLVNNAISGSTVCWDRLYEYPSFGCSDERTSALHKDGIHPDVIFVYLGTNDWGQGRQIACEEDGENALSCFAPAYRAMLQKLKNNYPSAQIWCFTLPRSRFSADESFVFPHSYGGRHIDEYCETIRTVAGELGCRVIDLAVLCDPFDTADGFHPTADGMKTIACAVLNAMRISRKEA